MAYRTDALDEKDIGAIKKEVAFIRQENGIDPSACLKDCIFKLLEETGTLILYPIDEKNLWGIYICTDEKNFYIINSSIELQKQIFAAAHELAHSLEIARVKYEAVTADLMVEYTSNSTYKTDIQKADIVANRFAAELLVSEKALKENMEDLPGHLDMMARAVMLSGKFLVPYRAIVKRLGETGIVADSKKINRMLDADELEIRQIAERYECCGRNYEISNEKRPGGYVNKALTMYENDLLTFDGLSKKLELVGKKPEDFGIEYYDIDMTEFILRASEKPEKDYEEDE